MSSGWVQEGGRWLLMQDVPISWPSHEAVLQEVRALRSDITDILRAFSQNASCEAVNHAKAATEINSTSRPAKKKHPSDEYFSIDDLAERWNCSRTTVNRIIEHARLTRTLLGEGKRGLVRIPRREVLDYERSRHTRLCNPAPYISSSAPQKSRPK